MKRADKPKIDPYATLGVPRDATESEIKSAFRAKAKKAHPDTGGSPEKFAEISRAVAVLRDPERRKRFDETGTVEEDKPDTTRAEALQVIEMFMHQKIQAFIASEFQANLDPRKADLFKQFREHTGSELREMRAALKIGERAEQFLIDMASRVSDDKGENPMRRGFEQKLEGVRAQHKQLLGVIAARELALKIATKYSFRFDPPPPQPETKPWDPLRHGRPLWGGIPSSAG